MGDSPPNELTARALVVGILIGAVLAASNVYIGLKLGIFDPGAITAAVLGFALLAASGRAPSATESNVLATCASSASMMAAASGLTGPLAAMAMLGYGLSPWIVIAWSLAMALFGILLAVPLRGPMITAGGGLPFPTGRATAEVIAAIAAARAAGARVRALLAGAGVSAVVAWFRDGRPALIPGAIAVPGMASVSVAVSPFLLSVGALIGPRNGVSILFGGVAAWLVLAPLAIEGGVVPSASYPDVVSWLIWPGAALLVASTLTSLALQWRTYARGIGELRAMRSGASVVIAGIGVAAAATFTIGWLGFGAHPLAVAVAVVIAPLLVAACVRSAGETDLAPVGAVGGVGQIVLGPLTPGNPLATLGGGAVVNATSAQATQMMYAFRTGEILGSSSRRLVAAQLVGAAAGALVVVPVYELVTRAYTLGSEQLPAGAALSWKATATAIAGGVSAMPAWAPFAAAIGGCLGIAITLLERTRAARFVPAPVSIGTAFLIPLSYSVTLFVGAVGLVALRRAWRDAIDEHGATVAAGGIAGEAVMGIIIALFAVLGVFGGAT